jgi:transposase
MEERLRFVARLLEGEGMSELCREFGISRKTGYKIFNRYKDDGLEALSDRSRRPVRYANQLPDQIERLIVTCKRDKPNWARARSANCWCVGWPVTCASRRSARFTRCSTAAASSSAPVRGGAARPRGRSSLRPWRPTISGVPISRASSSSAMAATFTP